MTNTDQQASQSPSKKEELVIRFRSDGRVQVLHAPSPAPKISLHRSNKVLTAAVDFGILAGAFNNPAPDEGELSGENTMSDPTTDQKDQKKNTKPVNNGQQPAPKVGLPVPEGINLDMSSEAKARLEEYQKTIFNETLRDTVLAHVKGPDATLLTTAGLIASLVEKNGQPAADVLGSIKLTDIFKPAASAAAGEGAARTREKAISLDDAQKAKLDGDIKLALAKDDAKDGLSVQQLVKSCGFNSPTVKARLDALGAAGQVKTSGEGRAMRYLANTSQPALPGTDTGAAA